MLQSFISSRFRLIMQAVLISCFALLTGWIFLNNAQRPVAAAPSSNTTTITISDTVKVADAHRIGINLGAHNQFGAAQMMKNVIGNPGFESGEFATIFITYDGLDGQTLQPDNWSSDWNYDPLGIGQPEGFWDGAEYRVVYGDAKGREGEVISFTHEAGRYTFNLDEDDTPVEAGDVAFARMNLAGYFGVGQAYNEADTSEQRPNSPGEQSLKLSAPNNYWEPSYRYFMDSLLRSDASAGQMVVVDGEWHIEIWAKAETDGEPMELFFWREGLTPFFSEVISLTTTWEKYAFDFSVELSDTVDFDPAQVDLGGFVPTYNPNERSAGDLPILEAGVRIPEEADAVWIDDIALYRSADTNPTAFTDKFVDALRELNPHIIRDWGNQLGSTLDNQLAEPWARKTTGHQPRSRIANNFHYSLHEFLELAAELEVEPWYVIPPTISQNEMDQLAFYLAAPAEDHPYAQLRADLGQEEPWTEVFSLIHLEYGNEMWGANSGTDPFIGATVRGGDRLGSLAHDQWLAFVGNEYFDSADYNIIIGGQFGDPFKQRQIDSLSDHHDTIALSTYFGNRVDEYATNEEVFYPVFARVWQDITTGPVQGSQFYLDEVDKGTQLAVYEYNFHTTNGTTPIEIRNDLTTGMAGALAMPYYMLVYLSKMGIRDHIAFQALQYSHQIGTGEYARVWGLLRDLESTGRRRPTWLGIQLANQAIMGDLIETTHSGANPTWTQPPINEILEEIEVPLLHSFAFNDGAEFSMMLFNLQLSQTHTVTLEFPDDISKFGTLHRIAPDSIHDDNEESEMVVISREDLTDLENGYQIVLPPHSIAMLEWTNRNNIPDAVNDVYETEMNMPLVSAESVISNDLDLDDDELMAVLADPPTNGTLDFSPTGVFTYTPDVDFYGTDQFSYVADDGKDQSELAVVTIEVMVPDTFMPIVIKDP